MALQLHIFADLRPNSYCVHSKPACGRRTRTRTSRLRFKADFCSSVSREPLTSEDIKVTFTERGNGMPSCSVAAPGYSSLLRKGRRQEMHAHAGDRFMQIAEWVYRKVKDPMVEIDPVTVDKKIKGEEEQAREEQKAREDQATERDKCEQIESSEETITTVAPATFVQPRSAFSRVNLPTEAAGVALILLALVFAYLGFRSKSALPSKSKQNPGSLSTSPGPAGIGGKRDSGTSRVIYHSPNTEESSPPQDLHEQFRYSSDGDSSAKAVALRASVALSTADSSSMEKTPFSLPPSVMPHEPHIEETEKVASHEDLSSTVSCPDSNLPLAKPFQEIVALNGVGHDINSAKVVDSEIYAKPLEEVVALNAVGLVSNSAEVADSGTEAKPFEEVVAANGLVHDSSPAKVADSEADAIEFQNALIFDKPQAAGILWPKEDIRPAFDAEYTSAISTSEYVGDMAEISDVQLPGVDFQNAILSDTPLETSSFELKPAVEDITTGASSQLVEDPVLFNLDSDSSAQPVKDDGPVVEVLNGAASTTSYAQHDEGRRKSYAEAIKAVVPAIVVGAGVVSTFSGVNSGLEMVGLVATASFLAREMVMASARQQLFGDLSKVKNHTSFVEFLINRQIIKDLRQE